MGRPTDDRRRTRRRSSPRRAGRMLLEVRASGAVRGQGAGPGRRRRSPTAFSSTRCAPPGPTTGCCPRKSKDTAERLAKVAGVDRRSARRHARVSARRAPTGRSMSALAIDGVAGDRRGGAARRSAWCCARDRPRAAGPPTRGPPRMLVSRTRPAGRGRRGRRGARRASWSDGLGRGQGDGGGPRRGGHLPALRRPVRMGQLRARSRSRRAHGLHAQPHRRQRRWSTTAPTPTCPTC